MGVVEEDHHHHLHHHHLREADRLGQRVPGSLRDLEGEFREFNHPRHRLKGRVRGVHHQVISCHLEARQGLQEGTYLFKLLTVTQSHYHTTNL